MNEEMEQFERRLKGHPLRQIPAEWRHDILSAARQAQAARGPQTAAGGSFFSILHQRVASLLWPHPAAWGGLAAIWIFIFAVNFSIRDQEPVVAEKVVPQSPEVVAQLQQQQRLLAELLGTSDLPDADRPKTFIPKPRSECVGILTA